MIDEKSTNDRHLTPAQLLAYNNRYMERFVRPFSRPWLECYNGIDDMTLEIYRLLDKAISNIKNRPETKPEFMIEYNRVLSQLQLARREVGNIMRNNGMETARCP